MSEQAAEHIYSSKIPQAEDVVHQLSDYSFKPKQAATILTDIPTDALFTTSSQETLPKMRVTLPKITKHFGEKKAHFDEDERCIGEDVEKMVHQSPQVVT
jgi:hypothetical protein